MCVEKLYDDRFFIWLAFMHVCVASTCVTVYAFGGALTDLGVILTAGTVTVYYSHSKSQFCGQTLQAPAWICIFKATDECVYVLGFTRSEVFLMV